MAEQGKGTGRLVVLAVFVLGLGIGWAGAAQQAIRDNRLRDGADLMEIRRRLDEEFMRSLDLGAEQRARFVTAREAAFRQMDGLLARLRPEADLVFQQFDQDIRPILSPRQLAVYDRIELERRRQMPQRPEGGSD